MKRILQLITSRCVIVAALMALQLLAIYCMTLIFQDQFVYFYAACKVISICIVLYIINNNSNPAYQIAWLIPICVLSIFGSLLYLIFGKSQASKRAQKRMRKMDTRYKREIDQREGALAKLRAEDEEAALQSNYLQQAAGVPPYQNTETTFFPTGESQFAAMVEAMQKAQRFIFLEFFIINKGMVWDTVLSLLAQKAKEGVDVRVMYDDVGCMFTLPADYDKQLEQMGIKACVFNRFKPILSPRFNNRDHRKICVVDGNVGFTGGINLADEYINAIEKYGHWKDCGVSLKGEAVWSLTVMFLSAWNDIRKENEDFGRFRPLLLPMEPVKAEGYVQPFTDTPLDNEAVGETVYLNLVNRAKHYVYISTPYLIPGNEMITALCTAAKSGVDVRIVTPHIPDKEFVHALTRSYYPVLVEAGVRIYEYTPGFIHAKTFVVDDAYGVVGTINLDYRSLFLHYECAAWMYRTQAVMQLKEDYLPMLDRCEEITLESCRNRPWYTRLRHSILRVFAPLM